jgi:hypothetical protein
MDTSRDVETDITVTLSHDEQALIGHALLMAYDSEYRQKCSLNSIMAASIMLNRLGWESFIGLVGRVTGYDRAQETAERQ